MEKGQHARRQDLLRTSSGFVADLPSRAELPPPVSSFAAALNSLIPFPRPRPISGSFPAPNTTRARTSTTRSSGMPTPYIDIPLTPLWNVPPCTQLRLSIAYCHAAWRGACTTIYSLPEPQPTTAVHGRLREASSAAHRRCQRQLSPPSLRSLPARIGQDRLSYRWDNAAAVGRGARRHRWM